MAIEVTPYKAGQVCFGRAAKAIAPPEKKASGAHVWFPALQ
jgi:hypothetical protein